MTDPPREGARVPGRVRRRPRQGRPRGRRRRCASRTTAASACGWRRWAAARWTARGSSASRREGKVAAEEEERRIFYVAATRAQEHLVLSGATDLEQAARARGAAGADALGLARLLRRAARPRAPGDRVDQREGREVRVRWTRLHAGDRRRGAARRGPRAAARPSRGAARLRAAAARARPARRRRARSRSAA